MIVITSSPGDGQADDKHLTIKRQAPPQNDTVNVTLLGWLDTNNR